MDLFNVYNGIELKVSDTLEKKSFNEKDKVDIPDGIYVGYEGVAVVTLGCLQPELPLKDKWNRELDPKELLGRKTKLNLPCCQTIEKYFGEETLELILKNYAPDLEFIAEILDDINIYLQLKNKSGFSWKFNAKEDVVPSENSDHRIRIYTNPDTDTSFKISFVRF